MIKPNTAGSLMKIDNLRIGTKDYGIVAEVIAQDCYKLRKWEPSRSPKFIVDVGCQIGCFSALASYIYKDACVLSFEMMRENYDLAEKNLSKFKNNKCFHAAVTGKNKPVGFLKNQDNTGGHKVIFEGSDSYIGRDRLKKEFKTKDDFKSFNFSKIFSDNNIDRIDFLKMDCEGSEYEIIPDLIETGLIKRIDNISLEVHGRDEKEYRMTLDFLKKTYKNVVAKGHILHCRELCT
jgi:FkbM family methyltransferase